MMNIPKRIKKMILCRLPEKIRQKIIRKSLPELCPDLEDIVFRSADTLDDYIKCFRLLHEVYVQSGFSEPSPTALRITPHHCCPESKVFLACHCGGNAMQTPVYTVSLFPDGNNGLPMDTAFKKELDIMRCQGRRLAEVGCLASNPVFRKGDMNIPMLGNRVVFEYATRYLDVTDLVITVHPKYLWVYKDLLMFEKIGEIADYDYVNGNPAAALRVDLETIERRYKQAYDGFPKDKNLHYYFFKSKTSAIDFSFQGQPQVSSQAVEALAGYYLLFNASKNGG